MFINDSLTASVGTLSNDFVESGMNVGRASFDITSDALGRAQVLLDGVDGIFDEIWIKPGTSGDAPDAGWNLKVYDQFVAEVIGRINVDETDSTEKEVVIDKAVRGTLVFELTGMGASNKVSLAVWII